MHRANVILGQVINLHKLVGHHHELNLRTRKPGYLSNVSTLQSKLNYKMVCYFILRIDSENLAFLIPWRWIVSASKIVTLSPSLAASPPLLFIVRRDLMIEPLEIWDLSSLALEYSVLIFMSRDPLLYAFLNCKRSEL